MSLDISINELGLEGLYGENVNYPFLDESEVAKVASPGNNIIYLTPAVSPRTGKIHVKLGGTSSSIEHRYHSSNTNIKRMISRWETPLWDKDIHKVLRNRAKNGIGFQYVPAKDSLWGQSCVESYEIEDEAGLEAFIKIVNSTIGSIGQKHLYNRSPYPDVNELIQEFIKAGAVFNIGSLPPRYAKTSMLCEITLKLACRIAIMCSYVGTVRRSYFTELNCNSRYANIKFIDPDKYDNINVLQKEIKDWLDKDKNNKIMYYVAMTGASSKDASNEEEEVTKSTFNRRIKTLLNFNNLSSILFVEESDFGCHCEKQATKIEELFNTMHCFKFFGVTGTNAERILKIFKGVNYKIFVRDYFIDVLKRDNAVKLSWAILQNDLLAKICGKEIMENWTDFFQLDEVTGEFREKLYIQKLLKYLFDQGEPSLPREVRKAAANLLNAPSKYVTEIFTPPDKAIHEKLKELIEETLGNVLVKVINGNETTNKDAEEMAKAAIKDANGRRVIFIAGTMGTRSFSVSEIKNIILMCNDGSYAMIAQKIARALTPLDGFDGFAKIVDMRLSYAADTCLSEYLSELAATAIEGKLKGGSRDEAVYITEIMRSGKVVFDEYTANNKNPFRHLTEDELLVMARGTKHFIQKKSGLILVANEKAITDPKICLIDEMSSPTLNDDLANENVKGDQNRKHKLNGKKSQKKEKHELTPLEKKKLHMDFLFGNANVFISDIDKFEQKKVWNEFNLMSAIRKAAYESELGIDMRTMIDIVNLLDKDGVDLDSLLERSNDSSDKDKRLLMVKGNMQKERKLEIWKRLHFNKIKSDDKVCLAFLGHPFYYIQLCKKHRKELIYIIEEESCRALYEDLGIDSSHIKFIKNFIIEENVKTKKGKIKVVKKVIEVFWPMKNFDKIIMNPPYTCGKGHTDFHLEILDETRKHLNSNGKLINLSPVGWLQTATAELKKTSKYNKYKNSLCKQIKNVEVIPVLECRKLFGINVMNDLGIYELDNEGGFDCTSLIKRDQTSLFDKVIAKCYRKEIPSINSVGVYGKDKSGKFHCNISVIHGNDGSNDFFDVCTPQKEIVRGETKGDRTCIINFDSDEAAENFRLSLNTIFYKYLNFIYKRNQNLDLNLLPWMGDCINPRTGKKGYKGEWTDEDFYQYFGITEDEQKLIEKTMEKYK